MFPILIPISFLSVFYLNGFFFKIKFKLVFLRVRKSIRRISMRIWKSFSSPPCPHLYPCFKYLIKLDEYRWIENCDDVSTKLLENKGLETPKRWSEHDYFFFDRLIIYVLIMPYFICLYLFLHWVKIKIVQWQTFFIFYFLFRKE